MLPVDQEAHSDNYGVYSVRKMWNALRRRGVVIGWAQAAPDPRIELAGRAVRQAHPALASGTAGVPRASLGVAGSFRVVGFPHVRAREGSWVVRVILAEQLIGVPAGLNGACQQGRGASQQDVAPSRERVPAASPMSWGTVWVTRPPNFGAQHASLAQTDKLLDLGLAGSVGRGGTAHDNTLM